MKNKFIFIIPLTPLNVLTDDRRNLQRLCFSALMSQKYSYWQAILIGKLESPIVDSHFSIIDFEGYKEEKLQVATQFIISQKFLPTHIIRLDDDDIFNPTILEKLKNKKFDLMVDKFQSFWNPFTGQISQKVFYWFPNTCIMSTQDALSYFGSFPEGDFRKMKDRPYLIENEHNDFHLYYKNKDIIFAPCNEPVYLRVLSTNSITSNLSHSFVKYLKSHGRWKKNTLRDFSFLNKLVSNQETIKMSPSEIVTACYQNVIALKNYSKIVQK